MGVLNEVLRLPCRQAGKRVQPASEPPEGVYQLLPRLPAEAVAEVGLWGGCMTPSCYNRPPFAAGRTEYGIERATGRITSVTLRNDWFTDRCATWDGVGIGQPTPEYQTGTPYPIAHGWDCSGCRWKPEGV